MSEIYKSIRENDDLDLALNYALTKIRTAIKGRDDDLHILNLVTIDKKNIPNTRNIVIRDFSEKKLTIRFHTDKRSSKISDIQNNNKNIKKKEEKGQST